MEFELGQTYSGYKFLDLARRSKRGVEFRVFNTQLQRLEILRALPRSAHDDQEQTERFLREMRVRARLAHPNIVALHDAFELERHLVMTCELAEGPSLADRLELGPVPCREAAEMIGQVLDGAGFAHEQQVIHRDINPENIILTYSGEVKLAYFGLAKAVTDPKLTQVGSVVGNVKYISPEQVKATGEMDARSDLYSLGIVFYEMLCGVPPFDDDSQFEVMLAHVNHAPTPPSTVNHAVPPAFDAVIRKALAKDPAARYQTAAEFRAAVAEAVEAPVPAPRPKSTGAHAQTTASPGAREAVDELQPPLEWLVYGGIAAGASMLLMAWLVAAR